MDIEKYYEKEKELNKSCPTRPIKPALLNAKASDLLLENVGLDIVAAVNAAQAEYDQELREFAEQEKEWKSRYNDLQEEFRKELLAYHGWPEDDPMANMCFNKAWAEAYYDDCRDVYKETARNFACDEVLDILRDHYIRKP